MDFKTENRICSVHTHQLSSYSNLLLLAIQAGTTCLSPPLTLVSSSVELSTLTSVACSIRSTTHQAVLIGRLMKSDSKISSTGTGITKMAHIHTTSTGTTLDCGNDEGGVFSKEIEISDKRGTRVVQCFDQAEARLHVLHHIAQNIKLNLKI